jgi:hypothetical protein
MPRTERWRQAPGRISRVDSRTIGHAHINFSPEPGALLLHRADRLRGARMGSYEPLPQLLGGLVGRRPVKGHQGGWNAGRLHD